MGVRLILNRTMGRSARHRWLAAGLLAVAITQVALGGGSDPDFIYQASLYLAALTLVGWLVLAIYEGDRITTSLTSISLFGLCLVHLPWQFLSLFAGLEFTTYVEYDPQTFLRSSVLACSGILAFVAGALVVDRAGYSGGSDYIPVRDAYRRGWIVAVVGLLMVLAEVIRIGAGRFLASGYFNVDLLGQTSGLYAEGFRVFMWGLLVALAGVAGQSDRRRWVVAGAAAAFVLLLMLWGYRGFTGAFGVAFYYLWARRVRPLSTARLAVLVVAVLLLWQVTVQVRAIPLRERRAADYLAAFSAEGFGWQRSLTEPGLQISVVNRTVSHFPYTWPYRHGQDYLMGTLQTVPFITHLVPADRWWTYLPTVLSENTVPNFLAFLQQESLIKGVGGSQIAEAYANFGPSGVIIVMFLIGVLVANVDRLANRTRNPYWLAYAAMAVQPLLWWIRNHVGDVPRGLVWAALLIALLRKLEPHTEAQIGVRR